MPDLTFFGVAAAAASSPVCSLSPTFEAIGAWLNESSAFARGSVACSTISSASMLTCSKEPVNAKASAPDFTTATARRKDTFRCAMRRRASD